MCSDDRFSPDSTVFNKPEPAQPQEWDGAISAEEYFRRAFTAGQQMHPRVQKLRGFFPRIYEKAEKEKAGAA